MKLQKEVVVGEKGKPFDSEPDAEEYEEYTGNEGPTLERWYHQAMLVIWPKVQSISIICEAGVSRALDLLEKRLGSNDPNISEQLLQVVCYCERNAMKVLGVQKNSVTPRLLSLCTKVAALENLLSILRLLGKDFQVNNINYQGGKRRTFKIGVRNAGVVEAIATAVEIFGWELVSPVILDLVKGCALDQGEYFAQLAKQLILQGNMDAGAVVVNTASKVFEAAIAVLESQKMPEFTWCQPQAKLPHYTDVENFLRGPEEKYVYRGLPGRPVSKSFGDVTFNKYTNYVATAGYSAIGTLRGKGREAFFEIQKTRHVFEATEEVWRKKQELIKLLRHGLEPLRSVIPEVMQML